MLLQSGTTHLLGPEVVDDQLKRNRHAEEVQSEQENKKIDAHMALANKVDAFRTLDKHSAECTVAQTKTMAMCGTSKQVIFHYQEQ